MSAPVGGVTPDCRTPSAWGHMPPAGVQGGTLMASGLVACCLLCLQFFSGKLAVWVPS